ncbi:hypothetical protein G4B88_011074 [Cannabis sativa]|uniref:Uncharacterized protein n=1 Tax=Cannabis sativa TaxID=3483 RepID=A0A7J6FAP4_CANSA|nr:hypothetical protein G4B88_011074 [Cannabis sativa]
MRQARIALLGIGSPVTHVDVTFDGKWILDRSLPIVEVIGGVVDMFLGVDGTSSGVIFVTGKLLEDEVPSYVGTCGNMWRVLRGSEVRLAKDGGRDRGGAGKGGGRRLNRRGCGGGGKRRKRIIW